MAALALASFADLINASDCDFTLEWNQQAASSADGEAHYATRGVPLWMAKITSPAMPIADAMRLIALVNSLQGSLSTFLLYDKRLPYPSTDPDGSGFGASTATVDAITDNVTVDLAGFPAAYDLPGGTYLQIIHDTSRYWLGQVVGSFTADGTGDIADVKLTPPLPDSVDPTDAVTVLKPSGEFRIVPRSAFLTNATVKEASIVFHARQTY